MGVVIDADVLIEWERSGQILEDCIRDRGPVECFVSVITASELLHGVHRAATPSIRSRRLVFVEAILATFPVLEIDLPTARCHAKLWSDLSRSGKMIGTHDSWLAATCLAHGLQLATANEREFRRVPGLRLEVWI